MGNSRMGLAMKTRVDLEVKTILDLCGGTGSWSAPYKKAGYEVVNVDLEYGLDIHSFVVPEEVYGVLAAPPCQMFSFARTNAKKPRDLDSGMNIILACLNIIWQCQHRISKDTLQKPPLKFWALENPYHGMLKWFLGEPAYTFDPWEFGDPYKKRTALWGYFKPPVKRYTLIQSVIDDEHIKKAKTNSQKLPKFDQLRSKEIHGEYYGKLSLTARRAITPPRFAQAFFDANK